jgi:DNA-binding transcriptional MerR regulator
MTGERRYLSIGEVLGQLLEEFPDVTISKIRFLESQGLIEPERTPSGYRKFYDGDVERLRMILREQRENYLPLRVIRDRLETGEIPREFDPTPTGTIRLPRSSGRSTLGPGAMPPIPPTHPSTRVPAATTPRPPVNTPPAAPPTTPEPGVVTPEVRAASTSSALGAASAPGGAPPALTVVPAMGTPRPDIRTEQTTPASGPPGLRPTAGAPSSPRTVDDLCSENDIEVSFIDELESHGIIVTGRIGGVRVIDAESVDAVRAALTLRAHGLEPRHLRVWKQSAERETALIEQLVLPLLRQRGSGGAEQAANLARTVEEAGAALQRAIAQRAIRRLLP